MIADTPTISAPDLTQVVDRWCAVQTVCIDLLLSWKCISWYLPIGLSQHINSSWVLLKPDQPRPKQEHPRHQQQCIDRYQLQEGAWRGVDM